MNTVLLALFAGLVPALLVLGIIVRLYSKRLGDLHRWVSELSGSLQGYERDVAELGKALEQAQQRDPAVERLRKQLGQLAADINKEQETLASRLQAMDDRHAKIEKKLANPQKPTKPLKAPKGSVDAVFSSPLAEEVLQFLAAGESLQDVARKTGLQVGEVELIRALKFFAGRESGARP